MPEKIKDDLDDPGSSWAAQVEAETHLPPRQEVIKGDTKTVIEYKFDEDQNKIKMTAEYKIQRKRVPKPVADRRRLSKFGDASNDPPGPSPVTTLPSDEVKMQFVRNRAGEQLDIRVDDDPLTKLKDNSMRQHCKYCKALDHLSFACPYKSMVEESRNLLEGVGATETPEASTQDRARMAAEEKQRGGTYVPPSMRGGGSNTAPGAGGRGGGSSAFSDRRDDWTVRVTNLPEDTTDNDLREMFKTAGNVQRIFLAKDKVTLKSKGFAFVTYATREDAEKAINAISGHRYDHLILKVEWARPNQ